MPPGGDGYYFLATYYTVDYAEYPYIDIRVNGVTICTVHEDNNDGVSESNGGCTAVVLLSEGKISGVLLRTLMRAVLAQ